MPIHFPTDAANDPGMNDGREKGRARGAPTHHSRTSADSRTASGSDEAKPGKGINQAGFIRDRDDQPGPGKN